MFWYTEWEQIFSRSWSRLIQYYVIVQRCRSISWSIKLKKTNDESIYFLMFNLLYRYKHIIPVYYPNKKLEYYKSVSLYLQEHFTGPAWYISQVILQVVFGNLHFSNLSKNWLSADLQNIVYCYWLHIKRDENKTEEVVRNLFKKKACNF